MKGHKATVLRLLRERGSRGVGVHELIYEHGITRAAAVVFDLKHKHGIDVETIDEGNGKLARYVLASSARPPVIPCRCGHAKAGHVSGFRCAALLNPEDALAPAIYCECEKYLAAA